MTFLPLFNVAKLKNNKDLPKIAEVINNEDPKKLGRIKVKLEGFFDPVDKKGSNLPWIRKMSSEMGIGVEERNVPAEGDKVELIWPYDEKHAFYRGIPFGASNKIGDLDSYDWGWITDSGFALLVDKNMGRFIIKTQASTITGDSGGNISIIGGNINIDGNTKIDGVSFLDHRHSNGNLGGPTGGVINAN